VLGNAATGVSFFSSLAEGANFQGADLTLADLESGNFEDANFTDAVLAGAFVNNAQLKVGIVFLNRWRDRQAGKHVCMQFAAILGLRRRFQRADLLAVLGGIPEQVRGPLQVGLLGLLWVLEGGVAGGWRGVLWVGGPHNCLGLSSA
jgi:hypothetical protein